MSSWNSDLAPWGSGEDEGRWEVPVWTLIEWRGVFLGPTVVMFLSRATCPKSADGLRGRALTLGDHSPPAQPFLLPREASQAGPVSGCLFSLLPAP